jgi:hypothetical protein
MGEGFGDFLMELDDLTDMVEGKSDRKAVFYGRDGDGDEEAGNGVSRSKKASKYGGHLIDEDEQEQSDIDEDVEFSGSEDSEEGGDDSEDMSGAESMEEEGSEQESDGEYGSDGHDQGEYSDQDDESQDDGDGSNMSVSDDDGDQDSDGSEGVDSNPSGEGSEGSDVGDSDDSDDDDGDSQQGHEEAEAHTYRPARGEDIYGRSTAADESAAGKTGKYVPPALRKAALKEVDEVSLCVLLRSVV